MEKPVITKQSTPSRVVKSVKDAEYYLTQAKQTFSQNRDAYQRDQLLIKAAEAFQEQDSCDKSIKMLQVLQPELQDNRLDTRANLIMAECYLSMAPKYLDAAEEKSAKLNPEYDFVARIAAVKATVYASKQLWIDAANALQKTALSEQEKSLQIWQWITQLDQNELEKASLQQPSLQPWVQLAIINQRFALDLDAYKQQFVNWQGRHINHPLIENLPHEVKQVLQLAPISPRKIAVLLPLTGRLASQGVAIKKGILASYLLDLPHSQLALIEGQDELNNTVFPKEKQFKELRFFDSALKTADELNELVAGFDVVIGPLMKDQLAELRTIIPTDKILLGLNRLEDMPAIAPAINALENPEDTLKVPEHYYFSLAPEDEAEQLAQHIRKQQLIRPVIFAAENSTTQRMAEAFIQEWTKHPYAIKPELTLFKTNKDMRTGVSSMLDVEQSKTRIRQIKYLADVEVFDVERNRRDIDAIVLFANPEQTELLNPIIEASLSPFARKSLSVFASSRSYNKQVSQNSLRDLRNLTFTDMPWMLPTHDWQQLAEQVTELWPQEQDNLPRLFAMGVDAYNLLAKLRTLKLLPQINTSGLTGKLSVDSQGVLHRHLPWAQVTQSKVKLLAMD